MLNGIWFLLIGVLLAGYAVLDGFDLGVGVLFKFLARDETEKHSLLRAIGPVWDGNEVWLLTGGGALFAAFPQAYATVFSGFYLALMLVLFSLILRAVSLEFWEQDAARRGLWEWTFVVGSSLPALLFGVALGNVVLGVPLNARMEFTGDFFTLLRPLPLLFGVTGLAAFAAHGAAYAAVKTSGKVADRAKAVLNRAWIVLLVLLALTVFVGAWQLPGQLGNLVAWAATLATVAAILLLRRSVTLGEETRSLLFSSLVFLGLWGVAGGLLFPNLVRASNDPALSLTITNAASSQLTLTVMLIVALVGMPIVIGYTYFVYKVFRGKVAGDEAY
jgi:cytochrome bd ubiquinol oxidase subunit II